MTLSAILSILESISSMHIHTSPWGGERDGGREEERVGGREGEGEGGGRKGERERGRGR